MDWILENRNQIYTNLISEYRPILCKNRNHMGIQRCNEYTAVVTLWLLELTIWKLLELNHACGQFDELKPQSMGSVVTVKSSILSSIARSDKKVCCCRIEKAERARPAGHELVPSMLQTVFLRGHPFLL